MGIRQKSYLDFLAGLFPDLFVFLFRAKAYFLAGRLTYNTLGAWGSWQKLSLHSHRRSSQYQKKRNVSPPQRDLKEAPKLPQSTQPKPAIWHWGFPILNSCLLHSFRPAPTLDPPKMHLRKAHFLKLHLPPFNHHYHNHRRCFCMSQCGKDPLRFS